MPDRPRRGVRRLSLRARLVLLVIATILPLTGFTLVRQYLDYRESVETAGQKILDLTRSLAVAVEKDLQARIAVLQVLARSRTLHEGRLDLFRGQAEAVLAEQFAGSSILLLLPDGQQVMNTRLPPDAVLPARRNLESLRQTLATGQPVVSDVFQGVVTQLPLVSIDVPVKRPDGSIAYVLSLNPPFDAFADTLRRLRLPQGWLASVLDRQGTTVARNRDPEPTIGQKAAAGLLPRLAGPEGVFVTMSREGVEVLSAVSRIQDFGWTIAMGVPHAELTAPALDAVPRVLATAGAVMLLGLGLSLAVSRQVTGPMKTLQRLATTADGDEILKAPPTGLAEADEVVQALAAAEQRRRQSDAKRREAERQGQRIFDTSQDVILVTDPYGNVVQASPSMATTLGCRPEDMVGRSAKDFIYSDDLDATRNEMRQARHERATRHFNTRYVHQDGHVIPLAWKGGWSEPDRLYYFIGRDMTEHNRTEEQLRQAQKMEAVGQLTGGVAHDFNNILMVIMANIESLEEDEHLDPLLLDRVEGIREATQRAADLTRQLLAFSRKQALRPQRTSINDLVAATGKLLRRTLGEQIEIEAILAEDLWNVEVDRSQLEAALVNLSINARDAMPSGGRLLIETRNAELDADYVTDNPDVHAGEHVMLAVTDTGSGMTPETLAKVFEPFFTTKPVGKGTGLGLSMVYGFIKQSGGHIRIYSEVGRGTSIRLYLPRHRGEREELSTKLSAPMPRGRERILVVEDDGQVRAAVVRQLESLGYAVTQAGDGTAALAELDAAVPPHDLLLTDVVMPGPLNGEALAREVARRRPGMRIVFMSGYTEDAILNHGRLAAGVLLLSKPFRKSDLAAIVRQALDVPTEALQEA